MQLRAICVRPPARVAAPRTSSEPAGMARLHLKREALLLTDLVLVQSALPARPVAVPRRAVSCRAEGEGEAKKAAKKKAEKPQVGPKKNAVVRDCCAPLGAGCPV